MRCMLIEYGISVSGMFTLLYFNIYCVFVYNSDYWQLCIFIKLYMKKPEYGTRVKVTIVIKSVLELCIVASSPLHNTQISKICFGLCVRRNKTVTSCDSKKQEIQLINMGKD